MKLLRTIRLDPSDTFVFERAAEQGEWAVTGSFMFWDQDLANLEAKARVAFRSGFLGIETLGWSTLVQIVEASNEQRDAAVQTLARHLVEKFGAPSMKEAAVCPKSASICRRNNVPISAVEICVQHPARSSRFSCE